METDEATAAVSSQSNPRPVPSRSIEVRRISPAPRSSASRAHATASFPVGVRPPETKTSAVSAGLFRGARRWQQSRPASRSDLQSRRSARDLHRRGVDGDFVRAGVKHAAASQRANTSADSKGHEELARGASNGVDQCLPASCVAVMSSSTISSAPAGMARPVLPDRRRREVQELHAFDHAAGMQSRQAMMRLVRRSSEGTEISRIFRPASPDFSGWN